MQTTEVRVRAARQNLAAFAFTLNCGAASASSAAQGIAQALNVAQQNKRGITLCVSGQAIGGAVAHVEPVQWVEMKNQTADKIIVRIDRIDRIDTLSSYLSRRALSPSETVALPAKNRLDTRTCRASDAVNY